MKRLAVFALSLCVAGTLWGLSVGESAPLFSLRDIRDTEQIIELESYRGQIVYVDFWASWCIPCIESFPALSELRERYRDKGFEVIAINLDAHVEDALEFAETNSAGYPLVMGYDTGTSEQYGVLGMPTGFFVNAEGEIHLIHQGFKQEHKPFLEAILLKMLAQK